MKRTVCFHSDVDFGVTTDLNGLLPFGDFEDEHQLDARRLERLLFRGEDLGRRVDARSHRRVEGALECLGNMVRSVVRSAVWSVVVGSVVGKWLEAIGHMANTSVWS